MVKVEEGVALASLTTMRVGGPAARVVTVESSDELIAAVREVDEAGEPLLVVSGGSNLLVSDEGFPGTVVQVANRGVRVKESSECGGVLVEVSAGESWDGFVAQAVDSGWAGVEALSGIPGLAGATPVQNVGAYGQDVSQTLARVRTWDRLRGEVRSFANVDCGFGYRHSMFKAQSHDGAPRFVVLDVTFQLALADLSSPVAYQALADALNVSMGERVPLADARAAVLSQRGLRGMVVDEADHDTWSCGSFFTNPIMTAEEFEQLERRVGDHLGADVRPPRFPAGDGWVKSSAAWLIDRAGFGKGFGMPGPAALSTKHTLALTNRGSACAADVIELARAIRDGVLDVFGVCLVNEPVMVGLSL